MARLRYSIYGWSLRIYENLTFSVIVSERYLEEGSKQFLAAGKQNTAFSPPAALNIMSITPSTIISF